MGCIYYFTRNVGSLPKLVSFRINPGKDLVSGKENVIGKPEEAKFGITPSQIKPAILLAKEKSVEEFGLHTMVVSNELDPQIILQTVEYLFNLVVEIKEELGVEFKFINLGGGIGVNYKPEQNFFDYPVLAQGVAKLVNKYNLQKVKILMENGRVVTGPFGYLITRVRHQKNTHKKYLGCRCYYG